MSKWLSNALFYEIYPQSFKDSNSDGIGDIRGIISKLDYIKELGANAVWLNPCFDSPFQDAGYDVSDYYSVAPRYGTNEDIKELFDEVHKRDMHILLDLVPGHTSIEHPWFKESARSGNNEYSDRYVWTDSVWVKPDMPCLCGIFPRNANVATNFFSCQPSLNYGFYKVEKPWQEPVFGKGPAKTVEAMKDIMRFWLKMGADGFRVDMAGSLVKNDEEYKGNIAVWQNIRAFLDKEFPDAAIVSEWGEPDKSIEGGFHMDFLLHFGPSYYPELFRVGEPFFSARGHGDASKFVKTYKENYKKADGRGYICIPSGNHDMDRLSLGLPTAQEQKIAFAFLLSMPGVPFIYYGDEIGMRFVAGLPSVEGGYKRTGSRSPMQWTEREANAGFSAADTDKLYIPLDKEPSRPCADTQMADKASLYNEVKRLIEIRRKNAPLGNDGKIDFIFAEENAYPLAYTREDGGETILVVINPSARECTFPCELALGEVIYSLGGGIESDGKNITAEAQSAVFVKVK